MQEWHSGSGVDFVGAWLRLFLIFRILCQESNSAFCKKRVATRSVKKGLGIPNRQRQIRKTLTGLPCLPSSEMRLYEYLDVNFRQHVDRTAPLRLKTDGFRRIIENVGLYPEGLQEFDDMIRIIQQRQ